MITKYFHRHQKNHPCVKKGETEARSSDEKVNQQPVKVAKSSESCCRMFSSGPSWLSHQPCRGSSENIPSGHYPLQARHWFKGQILNWENWYSEAVGKHCCVRAYTAVHLIWINPVRIMEDFILKSLSSIKNHFSTPGFVRSSNMQNMLTHRLAPFFSAPVITWWNSVCSGFMK